jgi:hypothetical protein
MTQTITAADLILCRSTQGDGGWSLYAPDATDDDIASGDVPYLTSGESVARDGKWTRPNAADYAEALAALAGSK